MPIHDWTRVDSGLFHAFHQGWIVNLSAALNNGRLPAGYFALPEQHIKPVVPEVLALHLSPDADSTDGLSGGTALLSAPPKTRLMRQSVDDIYAEKADRIAVRHRYGHIVAVIEIVSPGNKASKSQFKAFVEKSAELIRQGVNLLVIDRLPPTKRDPSAIYKSIWDEFIEEDLELPAGQPLTLAAYDASCRKAYVEFVGVGEKLPDMPLFLAAEKCVPTPLEETYQTTWGVFPKPLKQLLEP